MIFSETRIRFPRMEVDVSSIPSFGLSELVILTAVTGLACSAPVLGAAVLALIMSKRRWARSTVQQVRPAILAGSTRTKGEDKSEEIQ